MQDRPLPPTTEEQSAAEPGALQRLLAATPWPHLQSLRLRQQLLMLLVATVLAAMAALALVSNHRVEAAAQADSQRWAGSLARAAAAVASPALSSGDAAAAELALRGLASLPGVLQIELRQQQGRTLLLLEQTAEGRVQTTEAGKPHTLPDTATAWAGAGAAGDLGSVRATVSLGIERSHLEPLRWDALQAIAITGLVMLLIVYTFLRRSLAPLAHLARFAGALAMHAGAQLPRSRQAHEVRELSTALNDASAMLRSQLDSLDAAQARTLAIVNAVPDVILGLDADCCISIVNPSVTSVFGLPPEEMQGLPLASVLPGLTREEAEERTLQGLYMRATRTHVARFETTARRQDGTEFPVEVSLSRIATDDGARYAAVVRDVTEQRMTFSMLNLYSRALECTSNGVVISDMRLPNQPVFYANPAFQAITGYAPYEAIGRNCAMLQRGDDQQPELQVLRDAIREGRSAQVVLRNYRKDGTLFFNELAIAPVAAADGSVPHYVGVLNDVTERERARMAIAERSARLNAVFDLSPDGFVVFDRGGRLVFSNRAFQQMTGWDPAAEAEAHSDGATADGPTLREFDQRLRAQCDPSLPYLPVHGLLQAQACGPAGREEAGALEGSDTLVLTAPTRRVLARVVRGRMEGHDETILFFRDITRETEVDRMKSEFLTTAAHELRTPMVSVFGFTELLLRRPVPEERRRDMLETMHRQASLLIKMVNELLDLARIEARQGKDLKREACRLDSLVTQAVGPLVVASGPHRIEMDIGHGELQLWVDPEKTHRALINVLSNAVKYSPAGGTIHVRTRSGSVRGEAAVGLEVEDQGIGMSDAQVARVFERFYRADPSGNIPGTGLGMSLVKEIVELQGGRVELHSRPGQGTRVTLWFPLQQPGIEPGTTRPAALHET